jgi:hypothetical protein
MVKLPAILELDPGAINAAAINVPRIELACLFLLLSSLSTNAGVASR